MAMYGLGLVLLISAGTGRYALAGTVSAAAALGNAACAPQFGRLTDRLGQHRVLVPICVIFALSVAGLVAAVQWHGPDWTLFAAGVAGGSTMPQLGPMARARWSALLAGSPRLHTAFSVESIADELCFVIGPAAVTLLATQAARRRPASPAPRSAAWRGRCGSPRSVPPSRRSASVTSVSTVRKVSKV